MTRTNNTSTTQPTMKRTYLYLGVLLTITLVMMGVILVMQGQRNEAARLYFALEDNAAVQRTPVQPGPAGEAVTGELLTVADAEYVAFAVSNLPIMEPEETFQAWAELVDGTMQRGAMFEPDSGGITYIVIDLTAPLTDYAGFTVSREPFGGSPTEDAPFGPLVLTATVNE